MGMVGAALHIDSSMFDANSIKEFLYGKKPKRKSLVGFPVWQPYGHG